MQAKIDFGVDESGYLIRQPQHEHCFLTKGRNAHPRFSGLNPILKLLLIISEIEMDARLLTAQRGIVQILTPQRGSPHMMHIYYIMLAEVECTLSDCVLEGVLWT